MASPFYDELPKNGLPAHPRNVSITFSFSKQNAIDLSWDDPGINPLNSHFNLTGVNVYRSYNSELGPYTKITDSPVLVGYLEDSMRHEEVTEDVSDKFVYRGDGPRREWLFGVDHPIVKDSPDLVYGNNSEDVEITIDGEPVMALKVEGKAKCVYLPRGPYVEKLTRKTVTPKLPNPNSVVMCTYLRNTNYVGTSVNQRIFYKLTTVSDNGLESDLKYSPPISYTQNEAWDYIWTESVRRNRWILDQAGTDCWVLVRKWFGDPCYCVDKNRQTAAEDCPSCFGVGISGGYEGPFPFKVAPQDSQTSVIKDDKGFTVKKDTELWTNYAPLLKSYDLLYYPRGEVYVVGYVQQIEVRGNPMLQQHFNASLIPKDRIEYKIPFYFNNPYQETNPQLITDQQLITEKVNIDDGEEVRGNTVVFENWHY